MGRVPVGATTKFSNIWREVLYHSLWQTHERLENLGDYMTGEHGPSIDIATFFDETVLIKRSRAKRRRSHRTKNKRLKTSHTPKPETKQDGNLSDILQLNSATPERTQQQESHLFDDEVTCFAERGIAGGTPNSTIPADKQGETDDQSNIAIECSGDIGVADWAEVDKADAEVDAIHESDSCAPDPSDHVMDETARSLGIDFEGLETAKRDYYDLMEGLEKASESSTTDCESDLKPQKSENILSTPWKRTFAAQLEDYLVLLTSREQTTFYDTIERGFKGRLGPYFHIIMSKLEEDLSVTELAISHLNFSMKDSIKKSSQCYLARKYGQKTSSPKPRTMRKSPLMNVMAVDEEQPRSHNVQSKSPQFGVFAKFFSIRRKSPPPQSPCKSVQKV